MNLIVIVLRLVHILAGIFWAGSVIVSAGFLTPAARAAGPAGGKFMQALLGAGGFSKYISVAAVLSVLAGLLLYWRTSQGLLAGWILSPSGLTLTVGAAAGLAAAVVGGAVTSPAAIRLQKTMQSIPAGGPPSPEQAAELQAIQRRLDQAGVWGAVLMVVCVVGMAIARYV